MRVLLIGAHAVEEFHAVQLFHELGHEVFSIGAYVHPGVPLVDLRPPLPQVPEQPDLIAVVDALGQQGHADTLMAAKDHLPDAILDWAEVIICSALEHRWIVPQWERIRHKRVVWRTIGQSAHGNEAMMRPLRSQGLEIVRYSPAEAHIPNYAGASALIRFWLDPDEWKGWTGHVPVVTNVTQDLYRRSLTNEGTLQPPGQQWTSWQFWEQATRALARNPSGPGSEAIGGTGKLPLADMQALLRESRAYLFCGTQPASYTLGFMEALMTGIPVISIGPSWYKIARTRDDVYGPRMLETHELAPLWTDVPSKARMMLESLLADDEWAAHISAVGRETALRLFSKSIALREWQAFLGEATA